MMGSIDPNSISTGAHRLEPESVAPSTGKGHGSPVQVQSDPVSKLAGLHANETSRGLLSKRSVSKLETLPPSALKPSASDTDGAEEKKIEDEEEKLLKEVEEKLEKLETHKVLGKSLSALDNPEDPRNEEWGVKITLQFSDEKEPITLIPLDKKALKVKGWDIDVLMKQAKELLLEFNEKNFIGFNSEKLEERLSFLRKSLNDVDNKMSEKDRTRESTWEKKYDDLKRKPVTIDFEGIVGGKENKSGIGHKARVKVEQIKPAIQPNSVTAEIPEE